MSGSGDQAGRQGAGKAGRGRWNCEGSFDEEDDGDCPLIPLEGRKCINLGEMTAHSGRMNEKSGCFVF